MQDSKHSIADDLVDELLPQEFDWQGVVRSYPLTSICVAALGGYLLGSRHGRELISGISEFAAEAVTGHVNEWTGREIL